MLNVQFPPNVKKNLLFFLFLIRLIHLLTSRYPLMNRLCRLYLQSTKVVIHNLENLILRIKTWCFELGKIILLNNFRSSEHVDVNMASDQKLISN